MSWRQGTFAHQKIIDLSTLHDFFREIWEEIGSHPTKEPIKCHYAEASRHTFSDREGNWCKLPAVLIFLSHESSSGYLHHYQSANTAPHHEVRWLRAVSNKCRESFTRPFSTFVGLHLSENIWLRFLLVLSSSSSIGKSAALPTENCGKQDFPLRLASDFRSTVLGQRVKAANWFKKHLRTRIYLEQIFPSFLIARRLILSRSSWAHRYVPRLLINECRRLELDFLVKFFTFFFQFFCNAGNCIKTRMDPANSMVKPTTWNGTNYAITRNWIRACDTDGRY